MKATAFNKPFELNLETNQERYAQGDEVRLTLIIKNTQSKSQALEDFIIGLAFGEHKKIQKSLTNFNLLTSHIIENQVIAGNEQIKINDIIFKLDENSSITDKNSSLFIVYGPANPLQHHLELTITPHLYIEQYLNTFDTFFRFKLKGLKNAKQSFEATLSPASSREYASLEALKINFNYQNENLLLKLCMDQNKLIPSSDGMGMSNKKVKAKSEIELKSNDYLFQKGMPNLDFFKQSIENYLTQFKNKIY